MDLLLKRDQKAGIFGRKYTLWAKVDVDQRESMLLTKHKLNRSIIYEDERDELDDEERSNKRTNKAAVLSIPFTVMLFFAIGPHVPFWLTCLLTIAFFMAQFITFYRFMFDTMRKSILLCDLFKGRHVCSRDFVQIEQTEAALHENIQALNENLEAMEDWSGQDVVTHAA